MPTLEEAATIRALAEAADKAKKLAELRRRWGVAAELIKQAAADQLAAEEALAATASRFGVPIAEATTEYGLAASTAMVPAGAASGGIVLRVVTAVGGGSAAVGTGVVIAGAGVLVWILSTLAGNMVADKPIQPGVAMTSPRLTQPGDDPKAAAANNQPQSPLANNQVWIRTGPIYNSGGKEGQLPKSLKVSETNLSYETEKDNRKWSNTLTWDEPPATLRPGQSVTLTITASSEQGWANVGGWWNINCQRDGSGQPSAGSNKGWRATDPNSGKYTFTFDPSSGDPSIQFSGGHDPAPDTWVLVTYKYELQKP